MGRLDRALMALVSKFLIFDADDMMFTDSKHFGLEAPNWANWFAAAGLSSVVPECGFKFNEESLAIQAAIAAQGIALCSSIHVADDVEAGLLVYPFDGSLQGFTYSAVYLENHPQESLILRFLNWLAATSH